MLREKVRLVGGQARIVFFEPRGDFLERRVSFEERRVAQLVEPARIPLGRVCGRRARCAEAFHRYQHGHAVRPHARVHTGHIAAHAVRDEKRRCVGLIDFQQRIEICVIVGEPVTARRPCRQTEAAPIGSDHVPIACEAIDQKLERRGDVHPAVQQKEHRRARVAPGAHVVAQVADGVNVRLARFHARRSTFNSYS